MVTALVSSEADGVWLDALMSWSLLEDIGWSLMSGGLGDGG
jgi:hypothetical protein